MNVPPLFVGLDVGGTTMKAGVVDEFGKPVGPPVSLPTEAAKGQQHGLMQMAATMRQAIAAARTRIERIVAIGVATPGSMDIPAGLILDPPNLKPWRNVPVRQFVAETFQLPVAFQNDANAAAYGEYWVGAGREYRSMVLFTLGTGVGGGIILDDKIVEGEHSHGGELGHLKIEMTNPRLCGCGKRGCLEAYASASAVVARTREALNTGPSTLREVLKQRGAFTARDVFKAANDGDTLAAKIVDETAFYLALGASNLMHVIDPDVIAFAGGMTAAGDSFLNRIKEHVKTVAFPVPAEKCVIRYAQLGTDAGFIGAAGCARLLWQRLAKPA